MLTIQKLPLCAKGAPVAITLENCNHMRVTLLSYGATIQSIVVPDRDGNMTDVLLGYETVKEYEENSGYLGACIGRNGNRIANAAFTLNGQRFCLTANEGKNQLHGGLCACHGSGGDGGQLSRDAAEEQGKCQQHRQKIGHCHKSFTSVYYMHRANGNICETIG